MCLEVNASCSPDVLKGAVSFVRPLVRTIKFPLIKRHSPDVVYKLFIKITCCACVVSLFVFESRPSQEPGRTRVQCAPLPCRALLVFSSALHRRFFLFE